MVTLTAPGDDQHEVRPGLPCRCTPAGGVDLGRWNGELGHHWNRFCQALRRDLGQHVEYFRAVEVQRRGALHLHVLVRLVVGQAVRVSRVRSLAMDHGFGHAVRLDVVRDRGASGYCAKYVSKAAGERGLVPWVDRRSGEVGGRASYRTWTASRKWGQRMRDVEAEQVAWAGAEAEGRSPAAPEAPLDPDAGRYTGPVADGPEAVVNNAV